MGLTRYITSVNVIRKRVGLTRYMTSVNAMTLGYIIVTRKGDCYYRLDTLLVGYIFVTRIAVYITQQTRCAPMCLWVTFL